MHSSLNSSLIHLYSLLLLWLESPAAIRLCFQMCSDCAPLHTDHLCHSMAGWDGGNGTARQGWKKNHFPHSHHHLHSFQCDMRWIVLRAALLRVVAACRVTARLCECFCCPVVIVAAEGRCSCGPLQVGHWEEWFRATTQGENVLFPCHSLRPSPAVKCCHSAGCTLKQRRGISHPVNGSWAWCKARSTVQSVLSCQMRNQLVTFFGTGNLFNKAQAVSLSCQMRALVTSIGWAANCKTGFMTLKRFCLSPLLSVCKLCMPCR